LRQPPSLLWGTARDRSDLSQRDKRTKPGVLTPGIDPTHERALKGRQLDRFDINLDISQRKTAFYRPFRAGILQSVTSGQNPRLSPIIPSG
jgi:hypothetical protein